VWITFSGIHAGHNADSLLFALASVYRWTPFYWKQDRIGMLVPLVASGIGDPVSNLVFQVGLTTFAGLCVPLLTIEVLKPSRAGRLAATLSNALMLALSPERVASNVLYECNYPQAMALACAALLVLGGGRWSYRRFGAAAFLSALACWVYLGVLVWFLPLVAIRGWLRNDLSVRRTVTDRRTIDDLCLAAVGLVAGFAVMIGVRTAHPEYIARVIAAYLPPDRWADSWRAFAVKLDSLPGFWTWTLFLVALGTVGTAVRLVRRAPSDLSLPLVTALLLPGLVEYSFLGTQFWPTINDYQPRYILGTLIGAATVLAWAAVSPVEKWLGGGWVFVLSGVVLFTGATVRYGFPSPDQPRADLMRTTSDDLPLDEIDAVGGQYWTAWPAVFGANARAHAAGRTEMIYGVVERSNVLRPLWERTHPDGMRVAVLKTPEDYKKFVEETVEENLSPPVKVADRGRYEIYFTQPAGR
jgi:hypothetical protein